LTIGTHTGVAYVFSRLRINSFIFLSASRSFRLSSTARFLKSFRQRKGSVLRSIASLTPNTRLSSLATAGLNEALHQAGSFHRNSFPGPGSASSSSRFPPFIVIRTDPPTMMKRRFAKFPSLRMISPSLYEILSETLKIFKSSSSLKLLKNL